MNIEIDKPGFIEKIASDIIPDCNDNSKRKWWMTDSILSLIEELGKAKDNYEEKSKDIQRSIRKQRWLQKNV